MTTKRMKAAVAALGLALGGGGLALAASDIGIAKCKDGTEGKGPSTGAAAFCARHGGLESWTALDEAPPAPVRPMHYGPPKGKVSGVD